MAAPTTPQELLERNREYAKTHVSSKKFPRAPLIPRPKRMVVVTCLDHRVQPEQFLGMTSSSIPVLRNAGGTARNAVFDIAFLDTFLDVTHVVVIHHTNCGLTITTDEEAFAVLRERSSDALAKYDSEPFCFTDVPKSVRDDVAFLRSHPLVRKETEIVGFVYDIETGNLEPVQP